MAIPVSFRWDGEFVRRVDEARGLVPRSAFVRAAVEEALVREESSAGVIAMMKAREKPNTMKEWGDALKEAYSEPLPDEPSPLAGMFERGDVKELPAAGSHSPTCRCGVCAPPKGGAVEQALGSSGRAGVRGRVPASAPAEQPPQPEVGVSAREPIRIEQGPEVPRKRFVAAREDELDFPERGYSAPRVRSSSVARPFRPAPKQGKK